MFAALFGRRGAESSPRVSRAAQRASQRRAALSDESAFWENALREGSMAWRGRLPSLLRHARRGVPPKLRARVWAHFVSRARRQYIPVTWPPQTYGTYCSRPEGAVGDVLREIDLDVDRTGVGSAARTRQLRAVLLAFAQRNPAVGYCQGLNFIAAMLLHVFRGAEEEAFWGLVVIVEVST